MSKCVQCDQWLTELGELHPQEERNGQVTHVYTYVCKNAKCPNYSLLTTGEDFEE